MKLQRVTPERFIAKSVEAKRLLAFGDHPFCICVRLPFALGCLAAILFFRPACIAPSIHNHQSYGDG